MDTQDVVCTAAPTPSQSIDRGSLVMGQGKLRQPKITMVSLFSDSELRSYRTS